MSKLELDDNGIQTLVLGDGSTIIGCLGHPDYSGVCFSPGVGNVGDDAPEIKGLLDFKADVFLKIITDNPDSIQVLIDKLELAKIRVMEIGAGDD